MNFRFLRRYLFLKLCFILNLAIYFLVVCLRENGALSSFLPDKSVSYVEDFLLIINLCAFLSYFLFLLEIGVRYVVMKFVLKREETAPAPSINNKFLKILDGFYTFLLFLTAFYGFFICWVSYFVIIAE